MNLFKMCLLYRLSGQHQREEGGLQCQCNSKRGKYIIASWMTEVGLEVQGGREKLFTTGPDGLKSQLQWSAPDLVSLVSTACSPAL